MLDIIKAVEQRGYIDLPAPAGEKLIDEIHKLKEERDAVILAHYYQRPEVQDIADFTGDSLALASIASRTDARIILFAGVHFMAETAKILSPEKKVLLPDLNAGCSMADSCPAEDFRKFIEKYPESVVITYVNTTADVKTMSDLVCTSSNAVEVVRSVPEDKRIIFAPDKNLGEYVKEITGRDMILWDGACHVHRRFSLKKIMDLKGKHPDASIIAHPECEKDIRGLADFIGSTSQLIDYVRKNKGKTYIVATEPGVIHQMKKESAGSEFIPAPPALSGECACSECEYMKMITLEKIYNTLLYELPEIHLDEETVRRAALPIRRMFEVTGK